MQRFMIFLAITAVVVAEYNPSMMLKTLSLGDAMTHTLTKLNKIPLTVDQAAGFSSYGKCEEGLGELWFPTGGFKKDAPLGYYYTAGG